MAHHETTIEVPTTPDAAFAHLADLAGWPTWDPSIVESTRVDDGEVGEGTQAKMVVAFFGRRIEVDQVIERYEAPGSLVVAAKNKNLESRTTYTIEPADSGARITTVSDLKLKGPLRLLDKGLQVTFTNMGDKAADGLRSALGG